MHEWSLAQGLVASLHSFAEREGLRRITLVEVSVGELMELDVPVFRDAFETLTRGGPADSAELRIVEEPARFRCRRCGAEWTFAEVEEQIHRGVPEDLMVREPGGELESPLHIFPDLVPAFVRCPRCGGRDFEVLAGRDMRVSRLEGER